MDSPLDFTLGLGHAVYSPTHAYAHAYMHSHEQVSMQKHTMSPMHSQVQWTTLDPFNSTPSPRVVEDVFDAVAAFPLGNTSNPSTGYSGSEGGDYCYNQEVIYVSEPPLYHCSVLFSGSESEISSTDNERAVSTTLSMNLEGEEAKAACSEGGNEPQDKAPKTGGAKRGGKKVSDSRLSLHQLSFVLGLAGDVKQTIAREQQVLNVFQNELCFPLGTKTWIRDTPPGEREKLVEGLHAICESRFAFGYDRSIYYTIIRRASYSLMQGRLRRERRSRRKHSL